MSPTSGRKDSGKHSKSKDSSKRSKGNESGKSSKGKGNGKGKGKETSVQPPPEFLQVWAAVFRPYEGRLYHWSIGIYDTSRRAWHTYEAVRDRADGPFEPNYRSTDPQNSLRCIRPMTFIGEVDHTLYDDVFAAINQVRIPRDTTHWNCQNYVQEVLRALVNGGLLDISAIETASTQLDQYWGEMPQDFADTEPEKDPSRVLSNEYVVDSDSDGK